MSGEFSEKHPEAPPCPELDTPEARREFVERHLMPVLGTSQVNCVSLLMVEPFRDDGTFPPHYTNDLLQTFNMVQDSLLVYSPSRKQLMDLFKYEFEERMGLVSVGMEKQHRLYEKLQGPRVDMAEAFASAMLRFSLDTGLSSRAVFGAEKNAQISTNRFKILSTFLDMDEVIRSERRFEHMGYSVQQLQQIFDRFESQGLIERHAIPDIEYVVRRPPAVRDYSGDLECHLARILVALKPKVGGIVVTPERLYRELSVRFPDFYSEKPRNLKASIKKAMDTFQEDEIVRTKPHISDADRKPYLHHHVTHFYALTDMGKEVLAPALAELRAAQEAIIDNDAGTIYDLIKVGRSILDSPYDVARLLKQYMGNIEGRGPKARPAPDTHYGAKRRQQAQDRIDQRQQVARVLTETGGGLSASEIAQHIGVDANMVRAVLGRMAIDEEVIGSLSSVRGAKKWSMRKS